MIGIRISLVVLGCILFYLGAFLHEDEETRAQSWLEGFWIRLEDRRRQMLRRHIAFAQEAAHTFNRGIDQLLGAKVVSVRAVVISATLSMALVELVFAVGLGMVVSSEFFAKSLESRTPEDIRVTILSGTLASHLFVFQAATLFCLGILPLIIRDTRRSLMIWYFLAALLWSTTIRFLLTEYAFVISGLLLGILIDIAFVAILRKVLRQIGNSNRWVVILSYAGGSLGTAIGLVLIPIGLGILAERLGIPDVLAAGSITACTNIFDVVLVLGIFGLLLFLLLHRMVWSFISRPLYAIQRSRIFVEHKRKLSIVGVVMILTGGIEEIPAWLWNWIRLL